MMAEGHRHLAAAGAGWSLGLRGLAKPIPIIWVQLQAGYSRKIWLGAGAKYNKPDLSLPGRILAIIKCCIIRLLTLKKLRI
jgi:hypothetical protein